MNDFLAKIAAIKRDEVMAARAAAPLPGLRSLCRDLPPPRPFAAALRKDGLTVIAEVKRASPSMGIIRDPFDPAALARAYETGGAGALSVLTEGKYFLGSLDHLRRVKEAVRLPVLRKDFIIDEYQIFESRSAGADAVLLIAELLDIQCLRDYLAVAKSLALDCLVESHGRRELEKALAAGAQIVGVNNRDLKTLHVDLKTSLELLPLVPGDRIRVSESGIRTPADAARVRAAGADALLVGETLLRGGDIAAKIKELAFPCSEQKNMLSLPCGSGIPAAIPGGRRAKREQDEN
jgi:indole-3-glycerol phosphate synthase